MCAVIIDSLHRFRQKRQRKLQLGSGRTCNDARLRCDDDAVCAVHLLRRRLGFRCRCRAPDLHQDEHGRRWSRQVDYIADWRVPVHHRGIHRVPRLLRLPHIGGIRNHKRVKIRSYSFKT